jgi:phosphoglycolate phosphatase
VAEHLGLVIFDLDGTLLDTVADLGEAVNHALAKRGLPLHSRDEYVRKVGHGVRNLVTISLPEELQSDEALIDECLADFKAWYTAHIDVYTHPYPGMQQLLRDLHSRSVRLAIASNKFQSGTEYLVEKFFGDVPFAAILGNREGFPLKPDPAIVEECLRCAGVQRSEAILVGDSLTDMKTAENGGIPGIAVSWGYRDLHGTPGVKIAESVENLRADLQL